MSLSERGRTVMERLGGHFMPNEGLVALPVGLEGWSRCVVIEAFEAIVTASRADEGEELAKARHEAERLREWMWLECGTDDPKTASKVVGRWRKASGEFPPLSDLSGIHPSLARPYGITKDPARQVRYVTFTTTLTEELLQKFRLRDVPALSPEAPKP